MRIRRRKQSRAFFNGAAVLLLAALAIRLICVSGLNEIAARSVKQIAASPEFGKAVLASELPIAPERSDEAREMPELTQTWSFAPAKASAPRKEQNALPIKQISITPASASGYNAYGNVYIKNTSGKKLDMKFLTASKLPFELRGKGPHVLIVHTHGSESYFPDGAQSYAPSDAERTEDTRYNVVRVGDELYKTLSEAGVSVIHDRSINDSPSYNGSYTRTLAAISAQMKKTPGVKVIIDIHRDAMTTEKGVKYKTVAEIGGKKVAQIMIVEGTGESGLAHPNWVENLKFGVRVQNAVAAKYPTLMRPLLLCKDRFNMHVTSGSMLIEVGTSANSLSEALEAIRLFGGVLAQILKEA